jgi:glutamate 5-kinase
MASPTIRSHADLANFNPRVCVIKLGSTVVTTGPGRLDHAVLDQVAEFVSARLERGGSTLIVSSGAVAAGIGELGLERRPKSLPDRQGLAAVGQSRLMAAWADAFRKHDGHVAQILLTAGDLEDRRRYLNIRYTLDKLAERRVVPIINENDTVTVDELRFGDNDGLALLIAMKMMADCLVLVTNIGGLYRRLPAGGDPGEIVSVVGQNDATVDEMIRKDTSSFGSGGMGSKLRVARTAAAAGIPTLIAPGKSPGALRALFEGKDVGTLFLPGTGTAFTRRQRFIAFNRLAARGRLVIDAGAERALVVQKKSLLPAGVKDTQGEYGRHDVVEVLSADGRVVARGITHYNSSEVRAIMGRRSSEIEGVLGARDYDEIIHRDNLVIMDNGR